jgi:hypothetical protein
VLLEDGGEVYYAFCVWLQEGQFLLGLHPQRFHSELVVR